MNFNNRRAVLGSFIVTFIAIIIIVILLTLFVVGSYFFALSSNIKGSAIIDDKYSELMEISTEDIVFFKYTDYSVSLNEFDFLMTCSGELENKKVNFFDGIMMLDEGAISSKQFMEFIEDSSCDFAYIEVVGSDDDFWCEPEGWKLDNSDTNCYFGNARDFGDREISLDNFIEVKLNKIILGVSNRDILYLNKLKEAENE